MDAPGEEPAPEPRPGATARAVSWSRVTVQRASAWGVGARQTHRSVDVGFRLADRDKRVAAGVLAGGVAYRLFFWLLSVSVLATGVFGIARGQWVERTLREVGLGPSETDAVQHFLQESDRARWWVILAGVVLVLWTGYLGAKALVLVHAAVWGVTAPRARRPWAMSLAFSATALAFVAAMAVVARVHAAGDAAGLVADVVATAIPFVLWMLVSSRLPRQGRGWRGLVPGAVLVAIGVQAFYLFATFFLAPKLANATELYGLLGIVATVLFWLYVLGRLVIGSATLNASLHEHDLADAPAPDG